jgi:hypothetical protein
VMGFLSFWKKVQRGIKPTFVFDSKFTTYQKLSALNQQGIRFIRPPLRLKPPPFRRVAFS